MALPESATPPPPPVTRRRWVSRRWRVALSVAAAAMTGLTFAASLALVLALERLGPPPVDGVQAVSTEVLDRKGRLLRPFTTDAGRWRLPVDMQRVDPGDIALLIAYEDKRFYRHWGVDPLALARAIWQAASSGRVISGASTLTMQVARLIEPSAERTIGAKLREMLRALQLESMLSKRQILELYLRLAPFGGNLEGIRAASLTYFGKEPYRLALHEAALLVALPQSPELRRPDRYADAARHARDQVLERAVAAGLISAIEANTARLRPVPTTRRPFPMHAAHLAREAIAADPARAVHRLTVDRDLQVALEQLAAEWAGRLGERLSVAMLAIDNASGEVLAHVGSAGFMDDARSGQIDMTHAVRSPGSALKPFIYGLAFERGLAHPETLIEDRPSRFGVYAPRNFDQDFLGTVTVREALQRSLNVPAVRALDAVGVHRFLARLRTAGAEIMMPGTEAPGLAVALGGVGISLVDLARLYVGLARGGEAADLVWRFDGSPSDRAHDVARLLSPVAAWYITDVLRGTPPPANVAGGAIAFKTGTSYGYRDAWAAGFDGRNTVAVWVGRPDGASSPGLTGLSAAAPILHDAFTRISQSRAPLPRAPAEAIVASTADLPLPLREFGDTGTKIASGPQIAFPPDGARVELPAMAGGEGLALKVEGGALPMTWLVNGKPLDAGLRQRQTFWRPDGDGFAELTVVDAQGRSDRAAFRVDLQQ